MVAMEDTKIHPALTAGTKPAALFLAGGIDANGTRLPMSGPILPDERHTIAAICLLGQPFGFTREDVNFVHYLADLTHDETNRKGAQDLADRIEALLPVTSDSASTEVAGK